MTKIAIIGAGISGLTAASILQDYAHITLFEKSLGPGGRMATRNADPYYFDHGAQFFKARTEEFQSFIQPMIDQGVIARWDARFVEIVNGEINFSSQWTDEFPHYVGVPGMNAIGRHLAREQQVHYSHQVTTLKRETRWLLHTNQQKSQEQFDWVISTLPAQQTYQLLPECIPFKQSINTQSMKACFSLMLGFDRPLELGFDAALVRGHDISWISMNSSKPGRTAPFCILVHSSNDWANKHLHDDKDAVLKYLHEQTSSILDINITDANHKVIHGWMYANVDKQAGDGFLIDKEQHIAACGDWLTHGRVEAAFLSAYQLANRMKELLA